jgi:hypothetical protein
MWKIKFHACDSHNARITYLHCSMVSPKPLLVLALTVEGWQHTPLCTHWTRHYNLLLPAVFCCSHIVHDLGIALSDELQTTNLLQAYCNWFISVGGHAGNTTFMCCRHLSPCRQKLMIGNLCLYSVTIHLEARYVHARGGYGPMEL